MKYCDYHTLVVFSLDSDIYLVNFLAFKLRMYFSLLINFDQIIRYMGQSNKGLLLTRGTELRLVRLCC